MELRGKKLSKMYQRVPAKEAVAVDDYTVDLIFETPQPLLLLFGRFFVIPPVAITRDNRKMIQTQPIGTGPYRFAEWQKGLNIKLAKFEGYWGPKPQIDNVVITFRPEESVRLAALEVGEVDWVHGVSPGEVTHTTKVVRIPSPETVWLKFDEGIQKEFGGESILADKRLRLALDYAMDRQALIALYGGFATLSLGQWASPGDFGFNPALKNRPYDLEKARALVTEAGAVGKTVSLVCSTDRWPKEREVAEAVAYMIEKTGLKVKLMLMPNIEVNKYKEVRGENRKLKSDILIGPSDLVLEAETRFQMWFGSVGIWCATPDPEADRLYKEAMAETNIAKRGRRWARSGDILTSRPTTFRSLS